MRIFYIPFFIVLMSSGCTEWSGKVVVSEVHDQYLVQIESKRRHVGSYSGYLVVRKAPVGNGEIIVRELIDINYSLRYDIVGEVECIESVGDEITISMSSYYLESRDIPFNGGGVVYLKKVPEQSGCTSKESSLKNSFDARRAVILARR